MLNKILAFLKEITNDENIPKRDKGILLASIAYFASPLDIIPDFIPILGWLDDFILAIVILDYVFTVIDEELIRDHFPWDIKHYVKIRNVVLFFGRILPKFIKKKIWKNVKYQD